MTPVISLVCPSCGYFGSSNDFSVWSDGVREETICRHQSPIISSHSCLRMLRSAPSPPDPIVTRPKTFGPWEIYRSVLV